ncbi:hypothetical protein BH11ARM1_BH11ARM1_06740 [soil metagenome]
MELSGFTDLSFISCVLAEKTPFCGSYALAAQDRSLSDLPPLTAKLKSLRWYGLFVSIGIMCAILKDAGVAHSLPCVVIE